MYTPSLLADEEDWAIELWRHACSLCIWALHSVREMPALTQLELMTCAAGTVPDPRSGVPHQQWRSPDALHTSLCEAPPPQSAHSVQGLLPLGAEPGNAAVMYC